jgi:ABC-2 type transport system ATP-binding protein
MMSKLAHFPRSMRRSRVANLIEQFDLGYAAARRVNTYSGGMRRRLDLAISMIAAPPIVFLDEPTTGLDPRSRTQLWEVVRDLAAAGTTILLTTQYLEEADKLADTISVLNAGVIVATGTAEQLKAGIDGDHVILTFEDAESFAAARALGFGSDAQFDDEASTLRIPTRHAVTSTREVLARCDEFSISVSAISIEKPTLDDVFLSLTGADARGAVAA